MKVNLFNHHSNAKCLNTGWNGKLGKHVSVVIGQFPVLLLDNFCIEYSRVYLNTFCVTSTNLDQKIIGMLLNKIYIYI